MVIADDGLEHPIETDTPLQISTDGTVQVVSTDGEQVREREINILVAGLLC